MFSFFYILTKFFLKLYSLNLHTIVMYIAFLGFYNNETQPYREKLKIKY